MFDAFTLEAPAETRRRFAVALVAATCTLAALGAGVALLVTRPGVTVAKEKKVDVSFRPPPPPPEPAKIEAPPPRPVVKKVAPPPKASSPVAEALPPPPAPAPAPMVAPKELPVRPAPEADVPVAAREVAVGGTGDGSGAGSGGASGTNDADESAAPVTAVKSSGPINLPEDADPPEPDEDNVSPEYPEAMRTTGVEARVVLKVVVERDGSVGRIQVLKGEPPFVAAALAAVQRWRYAPAQLEGQPIAVFKIVNLTFQLKE